MYAARRNRCMLELARKLQRQVPQVLFVIINPALLCCIVLNPARNNVPPSPHSAFDPSHNLRSISDHSSRTNAASFVVCFRTLARKQHCWWTGLTLIIAIYDKNLPLRNCLRIREIRYNLTPSQYMTHMCESKDIYGLPNDDAFLGFSVSAF